MAGSDDADEPPIRWGILGAADIATKVNRAIMRAEGAETVAIASRSAERARVWAEKHSVPRSFGSYQALLDDPEIDAVYIPLPPSMHAEWTIRAAEHGKHVLCEKPLSATVDEAVRMAQACRSNGVQLMDGVMWVHHERTTRMRRALEEGALGTMRRLTSAFTFNFDVIPEDNIRLKPELAGGSLGDLGYYCARAALWAFGELPRSVYASARYHNDVEMSLSALLWFPEGKVASFDCGFDLAMRKWFEAAGSAGSLVCDDFTLPNSEIQARYWIHDAAGAATKHLVENCVQEVRMIERFSGIVRSGVLEDRWPDDAIATMRICAALADSARKETVVSL